MKYPKILIASVVILLLIFIKTNVTAEISVIKEACLTPFGMNWKTSEEARSHLLTLVKREAVGELFGEMIKGVTLIENFQLRKDEITALSLGFIRIKGNPEFFNGQGFGELCTKINAYVTNDDIARFQPRSVRKKVCISDPGLSLGEVRRTAEQQARIQAVRDVEPKLEKTRDDIVLALIHDSKIESEGFISETTAYCVTASGTVYPVELMAITENRNIQQISLDAVKVECWGEDISDNRTGGWKSNYPHCILDDGGGDENAIYDGVLSVNDNKLCIALENLHTNASPENTLAVGFRISLSRGNFDDGSTTKTVEMKRFRGRPDGQTVRNCFDLK